MWHILISPPSCFASICTVATVTVIVLVFGGEFLPTVVREGVPKIVAVTMKTRDSQCIKNLKKDIKAWKLVPNYTFDGKAP